MWKETNTTFRSWCTQTFSHITDSTVAMETKTASPGSIWSNWQHMMIQTIQTYSHLFKLPTAKVPIISMHKIVAKYSPAVYNKWTGSAVIFCAHLLPEFEQWSGGLWWSMVRPAQVVELSNWPTFLLELEVIWSTLWDPDKPDRLWLIISSNALYQIRHSNSIQASYYFTIARKWFVV